MDSTARVGKHGNKKFAPRKEVPCGNGDEGGWSELKMIQYKQNEEEKKVSGESGRLGVCESVSNCFSSCVFFSPFSSFFSRFFIFVFFFFVILLWYVAF